jgi:hypothetical protein
MTIGTTSNLLQLLGTGFEIWGALAMANSYLSVVRRRDVPRILWAALWRAAAARGASELSVLSGDHRLESLRGLALICLGFMIQGIGMALALLQPAAPGS